jgi:hypothetical protein
VAGRKNDDNTHKECKMKTENFDHTYETAISAIGTIEDEGYRAALIEAAILHRVRQDLGRNDPASPLAMALRIAAAQRIGEERHRLQNIVQANEEAQQQRRKGATVG